MIRNQQQVSAGGMILLITVLLNAIILKTAYITNEQWYWALLVTVPLLLIAIWDKRQKKHTIRRNFPVIGHLRYFFESSIRSEIRQYFFEFDLASKPFNRRQRSLVYQRAKNEKQTVAFGMQADPTAPGYEWVAHSLCPVSINKDEMRTWIGNEQCRQSYNASILNIGAMSYGALSKTAITALNQGAKLGGFAQNTGEGGISEYHLKGGDLIWQIGTGYFGCRDENGRFSAMAFRKNALRPEVKMIELKLLQDAKPNHGGILPAAKNTPEVAAIRHVVPGITVHSSGRHAEWDTPAGMIRFLQLLRELSEGKPIGFKVCIGDKNEFTDICHAITATGIIPDFITVEGAEGETGAALPEFTDSRGMLLYDALAFVKQTLDAFQLSGNIKILAAGKIITGFDMLKAMSLGASACYSARGMMTALGCIQALVCDSGKCPVGVATQNPALYNGLDPMDKSIRVADFHTNTLAATKKFMEACGFRDLESIQAKKFFRRINEQETKSFEQIYFRHNGSALKNKFQPILN